MMPNDAGPVLVTGATGFVGKALINRLARELPPGRLRAAARRPEHGDGMIEWVTVPDLGPETDWSAALEGVETVVHLAARVHVLRERYDPDDQQLLCDYRRVNALGTARLAEQAALAGVRRMLLVSTVKVLGESTAPGRPFGPDDSPAPVDPYAISKYQGEQALQAVAARSGMEWVILRPPLVYGPGVGANFARLWQAVARGLPLPLGRFDHNARSLVSVDNLVDLLVTCLHHPGAAGRAWLLHDGVPVSTAALVRAMARAQGRPARLVPVPRRMLAFAARLTGRQAAFDRLAGDLVVDDTWTREALDWTPPQTMLQALAQMARPDADMGD